MTMRLGTANGRDHLTVNVPVASHRISANPWSELSGPFGPHLPVARGPRDERPHLYQLGGRSLDFARGERHLDAIVNLAGVEWVVLAGGAAH